MKIGQEINLSPIPIRQNRAHPLAIWLAEEPHRYHFIEFK